MNAKLSLTASHRIMRDCHKNLNHRMIKIGRDIWKSLVNLLTEGQLTSKLDEDA